MEAVTPSTPFRGSGVCFHRWCLGLSLHSNKISTSGAGCVLSAQGPRVDPQNCRWCQTKLRCSLSELRLFRNNDQPLTLYFSINQWQIKTLCESVVLGRSLQATLLMIVIGQCTERWFAPSGLCFAHLLTVAFFLPQIEWGACALVLTGNTVIFATILGFFLVFGSNDDFSWQQW